MPVDPAQNTADLDRFARWATRVRRIGHLLRRIEYVPDVMPSEIPQRAVMVANHRSLADVFVAVEALHHYGFPARCLVRAKYFEAPVAGKWLTTIGCIPAGDGKRESVQTAIETLESDRPVAVMIEGKIVPPDRRDADGMGEIRPGFVDIAREAGAVILPIALIRTDDIWPSRSKLPSIPWRGRAKVLVRTGEAVTVGDRSNEEVVAETRAVIARYLADAGGA